ncbi:stage VI sporulation protein F [Lentibacillus sp. CBA3610]|uniref:stage VI sporulation protein F n=1 Tax=Lentibacillus sp. CBA3610 TaxID=2518176 RepID=UPI001595AF03|nr:stage VI sporulation protein F [Lentibacillus sp. CBA3610]QKY68852.1 stage VI sporulation protein F [Lentibacillus sp. CBA3610]
MDDMVKKVERKTGVKSNDIMDLAQSLNGTDLSDEKNIRKLVKQVSRMANKKVPKQTEDMIVESLTKKKGKVDPSTISKML